MKVLHFFKTYYPASMGGVEQVIFQLCAGMTRHQVESSVLSLSSAGKTHNPLQGHSAFTANLDFTFASTGFSTSVLGEFKALAAEADIIHYHFPWPVMDVVHFLSRLNKPTLVTYHSDIVKQRLLLKLYQPLMLKFLSSVDRIVATSPNYIDSSEVLQRFADKTSVVPLGIEPSGYRAQPADVERWRARLGSKFFLFVGALRYYKGLKYLLEAARDRSFKIVIVGSGPMQQELQAQSSALGLTSVTFLGSVSDADKNALLELSHALVFPSHMRSEAFGVSLLEGALFKKPLITCEIGTGTSYVNVANETGLVVPPADSRALGEAMEQLWADEALAARMGGKAYERFASHFTATQMVDSYNLVYQDLLLSKQ